MMMRRVIPMCRARLSCSKGYTLVETLVAMALFLTVLIPLGSAIGNLILNKSSDHIRTALHLAEREINIAEIADQPLESGEERRQGCIISRHVTRHGDLASVRVTVADERQPGKPLVLLEKSFLGHK